MENSNKPKLGHPKYTYGDNVTFMYKQDEDTHELTGEIWIVDKFGTFEQNVEPSYDIMVGNPDINPNEACLWKHIPESYVIKKNDKQK